MSEVKTQNQMNEQPGWHDAISDKPKKSGYYLCTVIVPSGGGYNKKMNVIFWDTYGWQCLDMIVTHWMPVPEFPKEAVIPYG